MRVLVTVLAILSLLLPAAAQTKPAVAGQAKEGAEKTKTARPEPKPEATKDEPKPAATDDKKPDAQGEGAEGRRPRDPMSTTTFNGLRMRLVGPAIISGRVVAFAVNPKNRAEYYAAAASGGLWKTSNASSPSDTSPATG